MAVAPPYLCNIMRKIDYIFIHCTASTQSATPQSLMQYFRNVRNWKAPGYHYVVSAGGQVTNLWPEAHIANGVRGYNAHALHVAWIGGIDRRGRAVDNRTAAQRSALRSLIESLHQQHPHARVLGHRDISPDRNGNGIVDPWERIKECPCFDAIREYGSL